MSNLKINQLRIRPLSGVALAAMLLVTLSVQAADKPRISANIDVKPAATLSAKESQAMSLAAGRLLLHTERARLAIAKKHKKDALKQIDQGLELVKVIKKALPKYEVTTKIKAGGITYTSEDNVSKRYVPVFEEQSLEDIVTPVIQAKKMAHGTDKPGAAKNIAKAPGKAALAPIEDVSAWSRTTLKLNVMLAADALQQAKTELHKGKYKDADAALAFLQTAGTTLAFEEIEMPLAEAVDNLKLAELEVSAGKSNDARATLNLASYDLQKYQQVVNKNRAKEVGALHQKITSLAESLKGNHSESDLQQARKEIASYWKHVVQWFK